MIEEVDIRISDLIAIAKKGNDMSLREKKDLDESLSLLCEVQEYLVVTPENNDNGLRRRWRQRLSLRQKEFVSKLLKTYIIENVSAIEEILRMYDFNLETVLYYTNDATLSPFF